MKEHLLLCRLLCSILLLSALTCKTTRCFRRISALGDSRSRCGRTGAYFSPNGTLPQVEVNAINALFGHLPQTSKLDRASKFLAPDCNNKFTNLVICDCPNAACTVTGLYLSSAGLKGEIPKEIGKLTSLDTLYLDRNRLSKIPSSLQNLSKLSHIMLDDNSLGGHIPTFFSQMKSLTFLFICLCLGGVEVAATCTVLATSIRLDAASQYLFVLIVGCYAGFYLVVWRWIQIASFLEVYLGLGLLLGYGCKLRWV